MQMLVTSLLSVLVPQSDLCRRKVVSGHEGLVMTEARMSGHADAASAAPSVPAGGPASARATAVQGSNDWWQQYDQRVYACIKLWVEQSWESQRRVLIDAVGEVFGQERHNRRE